MNTKLVTSLLVITSITAITLSVFVIFQQTQLQDNDVLFQASSLNSLLKGSYEGKMTIHDLLDHGDFGLGALEYMDGELVCLDAVCYQITVDGVAHKLSPESKIAFATEVFFKSDKTFDVGEQHNFTELQKYLDDEFIEKNNTFAIKINGFFSDITTRSIPKQDKLYVPLSDVVANQTISHFSNVKGTLVGFYIPDYMKEINVAKYHFHFVTYDREFGGHLINMSMTNGTIQISKINEVHIIP
jgi:acetolactate decarboxylase